MLKMMSWQRALEKELEQQKKELEKEREERKRDEGWLRNMKFLEMPGEEGDEVEVLPKQALHVARVKRNVNGVK